ncbi:sel1 repeat family protein [Pseudomonas sp. SWRI81]|uniref:tetratricopeptide repeat protein n=1 Tax=Pseudomonas sp. SWRI81 TaxID=2745505 RepID=UPI001644CC29|nr:sel1 repeat family protein [Pseudomonas sp. SWRI81]MBC3268918.1 sel1 repeat family protein [Pseudomonas sp. SWRI81]
MNRSIRIKLSQIALLFSLGLISLLPYSVNLTNASPAALNNEQRGIVLYNQMKIDDAIPQLKREAENGDIESQYYLAESLRKKNGYMTPEAQLWYESAAEKKNIYAMIQLGRAKRDRCATMENCPPSKKTQAEWFAEAKKITLPKANDGDPESLYLMYEITLDHHWLEKSANSGYPLAQYWMAVSERQGEGYFFTPGGREASVRKWLLLSSEGGNPKAMMQYLETLYEEGDMAGIRHWLEVAAATGEQAAMSNYGAYISHTPDKVGYSLDLVKGYAIFSLLKELGDAGGVQDYVDRKIEKISERMTPEQIEQSKTVAQEWKATHPPLSFFPDKLSN